MKRKKLLLCASAVCILASLNSCGTKSDDTSETTEATTEEATETKENSEEVSEEITSEGNTTLTYIGHASVKLVSADGKVVYIDPNYSNGDYSDEADIVLVTHDHNDHTPCNKLVIKDDATTITWKEAHPEPNEYKVFDINGIEIEAVPASNNNHNIDNCVGYIVTIDGYKIYHAGDTSMLETMGELSEKEIDYALYPIDGVYNMDASEATEVANIVNAKYNIPIHENDTGNTHKSDDFNPNSRLVLEYGETIDISE